VYERKARVGGNANTHEFSLQDGRSVRCGLSVLAWPQSLFKHYEALLTKLEVDKQSVRLPFLVQNPKDEISLNQCNDVGSIVEESYQKDMKRWNFMISIIRFVTRLFAGSSGSLYAFSFLNPCNLVPLRLFSKLFVSHEFWRDIVVPIYSTTFLTCNLDSIPCVIAPTMNDIIPLDQCPVLNTWTEGSSEVFEKLLQGVTVKTNSEVISVVEKGNFFTVETAEGEKTVYDRIICACDSNTVLSTFKTASFSLRQVLKRVSYADDNTGADFLDGVIHRSAEWMSPKVEPYSREMSNYVKVNEKSGKVEFCVLWCVKKEKKMMIIHNHFYYLCL
jgi:predicted NAD/FAD-binding protein